ncbi:hypothetical protein BKA69DRAFT_1057373 [Paraphysoderma sedebokerense]|nr:hypothetical protein BKA69DRAFT_1057373 [Paraphysoderma sedebokerense]
MRNTYLKEVRTQWKHSRFFFGKNKVMAKALGTTESDECKENLRQLSERLVGHVGLLFTNILPDEVISFFKSYRETDYARSGTKATMTVELPAGPVVRGADNEPFPHNMESQLRKLGLPTKLEKGVVTLLTDYTICTEGQVLNPQQAQLLKLFWIHQAEFQIHLSCYYENGTIHDLSKKFPISKQFLGADNEMEE